MTKSKSTEELEAELEKQNERISALAAINSRAYAALRHEREVSALAVRIFASNALVPDAEEAFESAECFLKLKRAREELVFAQCRTEAEGETRRAGLWKEEP